MYRVWVFLKVNIHNEAIRGFFFFFFFFVGGGGGG